MENSNAKKVEKPKNSFARNLVLGGALALSTACSVSVTSTNMRGGSIPFTAGQNDSFESLMAGPRIESKLRAQTCESEGKCWDLTGTSNTIAPAPKGDTASILEEVGKKENSDIAQTQTEEKCLKVTNGRPIVVISSTVTKVAEDGSKKEIFSDRVEMGEKEFCSGGYERYLLEERPMKAK